MEPYDIGAAFEAIEDELIESMIRNMKRHRVEEISLDMEWSQWQVEQLKSLELYKKQNREKFRGKFAEVNDQIGKAIKEARLQGNMDQEIEILDAIKNGFKGFKKSGTGITGEFFHLNDRKLEALIRATERDFQRGEYAILRHAEDKYRQTIFNAQVYANTGAGTYEKAVDMANKDFLSRGITCIEYANGARHTMKDYADMAIRTAAKRAYLVGEGEKRQEWGVHTVIVNKRTDACPKCMPFCGKVLIDDVYSGGSRADGKYPLLSRAIELGLYHPRCKDIHTTYFPGVSTMGDGWTKKELDEVTQNYKEEVRQQYAERQQEKYERLANNSLDPENQRKYGARAKEWRQLSERRGYVAKGADRNTFTEVFYSDEANFDMNLDGYSKSINEGISKAAREVAKRGGDTRTEHMYLVDLKTGELVFYETNGEPDAVGYDFWKFIDENPKGSFAFVHNHNTDSSFSETDLRTLLTTEQIPLMIAVRNDGVKYVAEREGAVLKSGWFDDLYPKEIEALNKSLKDGKITSGQASRMREELIVNNLLKDYTKQKGLLEYDGRKR